MDVTNTASYLTFVPAGSISPAPPGFASETPATVRLMQRRPGPDGSVLVLEADGTMQYPRRQPSGISKVWPNGEFLGMPHCRPRGRMVYWHRGHANLPDAGFGPVHIHKNGTVVSQAREEMWLPNGTWKVTVERHVPTSSDVVRQIVRVVAKAWPCSWTIWGESK